MSTLWLSAKLPVKSGTGGEGNFTSLVSGIDDPGAATAVTDFGTFLTDYDTLAAAIVVISGDTYSATTHQFTEGGSTGLNSAQLHTSMTSLNTALTAYLVGNADLAATAAATSLSSKVLIGYDSALSNEQLKSALRDVLKTLG